jgi:aspartate kinase
MLNGDPKTFADTVKIDELPFDEAIELAFYGASIIHPKTIQPLKKKNIPLHIKSFVDPNAQGTTIRDVAAPNPLVPNFILKRRQALLELSTKDLAFIAEHHLSSVYSLFAEFGVVVNLMQNSATKAAFCINHDPVIVPKVISALDSTFKLTLKTDVELLTVRHYSEQTIAAHIGVNTIHLEQRTPDTFQVVYEE